MIQRYFIGLVLGMVMLAGCSKRHLVQHTSVKTDSVTSSTVKISERKDSSFFVSQVTKKTLEGSTVSQVYTRGQLDSLLNALRSMPSVSRTIYATDPKMQSTLAIVLDSLGRINIRCTTAERTYYETSITQGKVIEKLDHEITERERTIRELETKLTEYQKSWLGRLGDNLKLIVFVIALIVVVVGVIFYRSRIKLG